MTLMISEGFSDRSTKLIIYPLFYQDNLRFSFNNYSQKRPQLKDNKSKAKPIADFFADRVTACRMAGIIISA
jgi:hypothetical protein